MLKKLGIRLSGRSVESDSESSATPRPAVASIGTSGEAVKNAKDAAAGAAASERGQLGSASPNDSRSTGPTAKDKHGGKGSNGASSISKPPIASATGGESIKRRDTKAEAKDDVLATPNPGLLKGVGTLSRSREGGGNRVRTGSDASSAKAKVVPVPDETNSRSQSIASAATDTIQPNAEFDGIDYCYITPRILVTGRPTVRESKWEDHRVNETELAKFLSKKHGNNYVVFNLSNKTRSSIDYSKFNTNQVVEFTPYSRQDVTDEIPAIGQIYRFCYAMSFWMAWGPETVAVIHCNDGIGRTGFYLAAYNVYSGMFKSLDSALADFGAKRCEDPRFAESYPASWKYLLTSLGRLLSGKVVLPKALSLDFIVIKAEGLISRSPEFPDPRNPRHWPQVQIYEGPKLTFDSERDCVIGDTIRWDDGSLVVEVHRAICGDYQIWLLTPPTEKVVATSMEQIRRLRVVESGSSAGAEAGMGSGGLRVPNAGSSAQAQATDINIADENREGQTTGQDYGTDGFDDISGYDVAPGFVRRSERRLAARLAFHTNFVDAGPFVFDQSQVDIFRSAISRNDFKIILLSADVEFEVATEHHLDSVMRRGFLNISQGDKALQQGSNDFSSHHYTFPNPKFRSELVSEGIDEVAAVCALQRAANNIGAAREYIDREIFRRIFKEPAAFRDLLLLRETLTSDEIAAILAARGNVFLKKKGIALEDLDYSALLKAAQLGNVGLGNGKGGRGRGRGRGGGGLDGEAGAAADDSAPGDDEDGDNEDDEEANDYSAVSSAASSSAIAAAAVAASDWMNAGGKDGKKADAEEDEDEDDEGEDEEEGGTEWTMKEHPIFGKWFKILAEGKQKADVLNQLAEEKWNPGILDVSPDALVPENLPAATVPLKDWEWAQKYFKMTKVGLPRPVVEHKMISEFANPGLLDLNPDEIVPANKVSPQKKSKKKGPSIIRKKLHWVPIKGKVDGTIWAGPPTDLIAAQPFLIEDEKEFKRLFIQNPEDVKKKKKSEGAVVQLVDAKRAMNAGIALAKLKTPITAVVDCLTKMSARSGKHLLSMVEVQNLVQLCPTDDEIKLVKGYKGDVNKLGLCEKFFLAVADVPSAKARASGLFYQLNFDERVASAKGRVELFSKALYQIHSASRLKRFLKAVLVLGNKMNGKSEKSRKGVVKAFTVYSLHQLNQTKAFDQQTSVLQYLIRVLRRKDPDLLYLSKDFPDNVLAEAKRIPLDVVAEETKDLRDGLSLLEATVKDAVAANGGWDGMNGQSEDGSMYVDEEIAITADDPAEKKKQKASTDGSIPAESAPAASGGPPSGGSPDMHNIQPATVDPLGSASGAPAEEKGKETPQPTKRKVRRRVEPLPVFAALAQARIQRLTEAFDTATQMYKDLLKFFKEDPELGASDLFGNIHLFLETFDKTIKGMIEKKRKERDARRRHEEMEATKRRAQRRKEAIERGEDPPPETPRVKKAKPSKGGDNVVSGSGHPDSFGFTSSDEEGKVPKRPKLSATTASTWAVAAPATGGKAPGGSPSDDDEDDDNKPSASSPAANPRSALLAAISGSKKETSSPVVGGVEGQATTESNGKSSASDLPSADPRAGLLAAIRKKNASGGISTDKSPVASDASDSNDDPRAGLLAAIRKKEPRALAISVAAPAASSTAAPAVPSATSPASISTAPAPESAETKEVQSDADDTSGGDPRNALLSAIRKRAI